MVTKFNTSAPAGSGSGSGSGKVILTLVLVGLIAYFGYKMFVQKKPATEEKKA